MVSPGAVRPPPSDTNGYTAIINALTDYCASCTIQTSLALTESPTTYRGLQMAKAIIVPKDVNLARGQESNGDSRVDVTTAEGCNHPENRRHAEAERQ